MTIWTWFIAGFIAGFSHAGLLWRATQRHSIWTALFGFLRLSVVAAVLVFAAISGGILAAAVGWLIGLSSLSIGLLLKGGGQCT